MTRKRMENAGTGFGRIGQAFAGSALLVLLLLASSPAWAQAGAVYYVDADATGANSGTSWADAYTKLQDALGAASSGAQIWVAEGVYYPDEGSGQTDNSRSSTFNLKHGVDLYGGFDPQAGIDAFGERDPAAYVTVLSGDLAQNDTTDANGVVADWTHIVGTDNAYHVLFAGNWYPSVGVTVTVDGFTITAGREENHGSLTDCGAGLFSCSASVLTLNNLVFSGNTALPYGPGGAVYFWETTQTLTDVKFVGNAGCQGGAVHCRAGSSTFTRVVFETNDAVDSPDGICGTGAVSGGGLAANGTTALTDVQFLHNTAHDGGGGLTAFVPVTIRGGLFEGNTAGYLGGGMEDSGCSTLTDVTFRDNSGPSYGGGGLGGQCDSVPGHYTRVSFLGNSTPGIGGGLFTNPSSQYLDLVDAVVAGNQAGQGGGIHMYYGDLRVTNAVVSGNRSDWGAIHAYFGTVTLNNVTVTGNSGAGLNTWNSPTWNVRNSIFWNNGGGSINSSTAPTLLYSIVQGGCPSGATCDHVVNSDPLFVTPVDPATSPTTAGNVRLQSTSPAIDAGDNTAVPADVADLDGDGNTTEVLPYDLDENPRFVDYPPTGGSGNGSSPFADFGPYEYADMPDLVVTKSNDVGGSAAYNVPFTWTLTITNAGSDPATFTYPNNVILKDYLPLYPSEMNYGARTITTTDCTGTYAWWTTIVDSVLTVTLSSGSITLAPNTGTIRISFPATPKVLGTLVNPRSGGYCRVDPLNHVRESQEGNNDCSDTITVGVVEIAASIHDAAHAAVPSAPVGAAVHGHVTVVGPAGTIPTGSVTLELYTDAACTGVPFSTETQTLASGAADFTTFPAATLWHKVLYAGSSSHQPGASACTLFAAVQPGPTFTVNTTEDSALDGLCTDLHCTLREAVAAANAAAGANTILFDVGSGQTLTLGSPLPTLLDATGALTVDGEDRALTVSGNDLYPVFKVGAGTTATLARLAIAHGGRTDPECSGGTLCGGGLTVWSGATATLVQGAVETSASDTGGGIFNLGNLTVQDTTVSGNSGHEGGGILNGGTLSLVNSTVSGNTAAYYGGAILNNGALTVQNSTLSGNTVTGTSAWHGGGALDQFGAGSSSTLASSTVTNNTAGSPIQARSGIWVEDGAAVLRNSVVALNSGTNNFSVSGGTLASEGYNLANDWNGLTTLSTDLTADPLLAPLASYGGPTYTHALQADSPALDSGVSASCPAVDQRGTPRPQGDRCDIGAYEKVQYTIGDLTVAKSGLHDVELDWTATGGVCRVYRSDSPSGGFAIIASPSGPPFSDVGAQDGTEDFFYLIKAIEAP